MVVAVTTQEPVQIGSRLELLVDESLMEAKSGDLALRLHHPVRREVVFRTDAPWEGNASAYQSIFKDGPIYRMYYHGLHYRHSGPPAQAREDHPQVMCYAESEDGLNWRRPELGLHEFNGSRANNIIMTQQTAEEVGADPAHAVVLLDANPDCPADERYKMAVVGSKPFGIYLMGSGDGVNFRLLSTEPIFTDGALDSQNLLFWDPVRAEYREYHRDFRDGCRDIRTSTSRDPLHFSDFEWLSYPGAPRQQLYTNQVQPYYRAPHIFMGFPMRYNDLGWSNAVLDLPGTDERMARAAVHPRYGTVVTDAVFMSSRDGVSFQRWSEAFIRPGPRSRGSWVYGDNFVFWGMLETPSGTADCPPELSLYATEDYWEGIGTAVRRYTLRLDGFVSAHTDFGGGQFVTKPLVFDGGSLALNLETGGAAGVQVEVQEADGTVIEGYALEDCPVIRGDTLRHIVLWNGNGGDLRRLAGRPVRLRFRMQDADLYAFQFVTYEAEPVRPVVPPHDPSF